MSTENMGWVIAKDNGTLFLHFRDGVYHWKEHPSDATLFDDYDIAFRVSTGLIETVGIRVVPYTPQPLLLNPTPIGYFVQPYADNPNVIERVDDSCKSDEDVFPLYKALDVTAAQAIVDRLESIKLGIAYNGIVGTDCFNNGITAAQVEILKYAMLNRTEE